MRSTTRASLERLAADVDLVTYEFENVPVGALHAVARSRPCLPPVGRCACRRIACSRRSCSHGSKIPTPPFRAVDSLADLRAAVAALGLPCVLKTRRLGYDGKGQQYLRKPADLEPAWAALGGVPLILEGFVRFDREVSIIGARSTRGRSARLPARRQHASRRHPARDARAAPQRGLAEAAERHLKRAAARTSITPAC